MHKLEKNIRRVPVSGHDEYTVNLVHKSVHVKYQVERIIQKVFSHKAIQILIKSWQKTANRPFKLND